MKRKIKFINLISCFVFALSLVCTNSMFAYATELTETTPTNQEEISSVSANSIDTPKVTSENKEEAIDLNNLFREDASIDSTEAMPNAQEEIGEVIYIPETIEEEKEIQETINEQQQKENVENEVSQNEKPELNGFDASDIDNENGKQSDKTNSNNGMLVAGLTIGTVLIGGIGFTIYNVKKNKDN